LFELHNPNIDWRKRTLEESNKVPTKDKGFHKISTISIHQLYEEGGRENMFVFVVVATPSSTSQEFEIQLPEKYADIL
jgi:hypothetical protein